jgi:hypothetical protein
MHQEFLIGPSCKQLILSHLFPEDDEEFWLTAISILLHDVEAELTKVRLKSKVYVQIGACSHWLQPHQTRWTAAGGFAWPSGYGGSGYSRIGVPEFDWYVSLCRETEEQNWQPVEKFSGKRHFIFRAALPTRTKRHPQAAIHTLWFPGRPSNVKEESIRFYGFRKVESIWECVTTSAIDECEVD